MTDPQHRPSWHVQPEVALGAPSAVVNATAARPAHHLRGFAISLIFLVFSVIDFLNAHPSLPRLALVGPAVAVFVCVYLGCSLAGVRRTPLGAPVCVCLLAALAATLTLADRSGWASLFVYTAAAAGYWLSPPWNARAVSVLAGLAAATTAIAGGGISNTVAMTATTAAVGVMMLAFARLIRVNAELRAAREELAQVAVAQERLRFARDLHDLLGHSLSVIAVKAELAEKLVPAHPQKAAQHIGECKDVARSALSEVRQAVSGYREPRLAAELAGARLALTAAGIEMRLDDSPATLAPDVEAVLAWTVREGATNVLRHSGATTCSFRIRAGLAAASIEIVDNGRGGSPSPGGHGLVGLRERVTATAGSMSAGPGEGGGFRLHVSVPVSVPVSAASTREDSA
jgi:two-component system, NarL family, sensor histidine kinase DesK